MPIVRLNEFNELQQAILKSFYKEVRHRVPMDGAWREFSATININGKPYLFECAFRHDGHFLSIARKRIRDGQGRLIAPTKGIALSSLQ